MFCLRPMNGSTPEYFVHLNSREHIEHAPTPTARKRLDQSAVCERGTRLCMRLLPLFPRHIAQPISWQAQHECGVAGTDQDHQLADMPVRPMNRGKG